MARLSGMSSDAFSSTSAGLGSILRDQKAFTGGASNRANVLLGISHHRTVAQTVSMASSPAESLVFDPDASGDELDDFTEEDIWAAEVRSWHHDPSKQPQDAESHKDLTKRSCSTGSDSGLGLGIGNLKQGLNNVEKLRTGKHLKQRSNGGLEEFALGIHNKQQNGDIVLSASRHRENGGLGFRNSFLNSSASAVGLTPVPRVSDNSNNMSSIKSTASWVIPQGSRVSKDMSRSHVERQSAPVQVPEWSKIMAKPKSTKINVMDTNSDDDNDEDERLPPHELVAREYARSQRTTFSVCEGQGRTLKGRDLSRVRNAVWSQMGFAD